MFPYFLIYPVFLAASLVWPALQSLHALHAKDEKEMKVWLWYWLGYAIMTVIFSLPLVETIVYVPFGLISTVLFDVYYEFQLAVVVALVNPQVRCLDKVILLIEENMDTALKLGSDCAEQAKVKVEEVVRKVSKSVAKDQ